MKRSQFVSEIQVRRERRPLIGMIWVIGLIAAVGGCTSFDVNIPVNEPFVVDLPSMKVPAAGSDADAEAKEVNRVKKSYKDALNGLRNRMDSIRDRIKSNGFVGENRDGLLEILKLPEGDWGEWVEETVRAENRDRNTLIKFEAEQKGVRVEEVRTARWKEAVRKSFPDEWIEVAGEEPGTYRWEQKRGALGSTE